MLKNPIERGLYLLELNGIDYEIESSKLGQEESSEKQQILMDILELNELIDEIDNENQLEELEERVNEVISPLENELTKAFASTDMNRAVKLLGKMKYYQNIVERLDDLKLKFNIV